MRKSGFARRKLAILAVSAMTLFAGCASIFKHSHTLFFTGSTPPDTAAYCGVKASQQMAVPYTLYVSATAIGSPGAVLITLRSGSSLATPVPAGMTISTTQKLKGVLNVDDVVKITAVGGVQSMMASVATGVDAEDPFEETLDGGSARGNHFCLTAPRDPGRTSAATMIP
ncbi:MAG: hypothetical protein HYT78_17610 [Deltaproteobacteria bacterium]|nr:hypothetical protein [Deltaproteobacteria bacterium]